MDFRKHATILAVVERLNAAGSWTGRTHVQKALYLLNDAAGCSLPFEFVLYKHGPYSFDVDAELEQMKSYAAIAATPRAPAGVTLFPASNAQYVKDRSPLNQGMLEHIDHICSFVGRMDVHKLEALSTAVWIETREQLRDEQKVADRLVELKPHVSRHDAKQAYHCAAKLKGSSSPPDN